ncbi:MAG: hypothetical protein GY832_12085 [Chloroflexi bacterium]|nr:hypothetical protein [Chloroflexota bacterium]
MSYPLATWLPATRQQLLTASWGFPVEVPAASEVSNVEVASGGGSIPFGPKRGGVSGATTTSKTPTAARRTTAKRNAIQQGALSKQRGRDGAQTTEQRTGTMENGSEQRSAKSAH